jgi:NTP pyrophosphatase (non-canonical NTP hydrolase)
MLTVAQYAEFVRKTDLGKDKPEERFDIALYGLAGEVGSLGAAIKKRLLSAGRKNWSLPNDEIVEELGDSLWYCFAVGEARGIGSSFIPADIELLQEEVGGGGDRSRRIRDVLGERANQFLAAAPCFLRNFSEGSATLEQFRIIAFLTSRTRADQLVEVCLAVLQQLTAELMRHRLPTIELELNTTLPDRPIEHVLGEIIWHLAALASLYSLDLDKVALSNMSKLHRRFGRDDPTPLPDRDRPEDERFPRKFEVAFVPVGKGRSRMYLGGQRLGDDLTDNAYDEDGYRFHDVMHLALAAKLGWSPVLRKLMGRKRRRERQLDEVEDGARAAIVEEAIINAIYAEGRRVAGLTVPLSAPGPVQLFTDSSDISFTFLKRLETLAVGLEVADCKYWEWEDAILEGFAIFNRLRGAGRGTVSVDLEQRTLTFSPHVLMEFSGMVAGIGLGQADATTPIDSSDFDKTEADLAATYGADAVMARRQAVIAAAGLPQTCFSEIHIGGWRGNVLDVRATGDAQSLLWQKGIVAFQAHAIDIDGGLRVTAVALSDR